MKNGVLDVKVENEMKIMQRVKHVGFVSLLSTWHTMLTPNSPTSSNISSIWTGIAG